MPPFQDLSGRRFGRLKVLKRVKNDKYKHVKYLCMCDCGKIVEVRGDGLLSKHTQSCSCLHDEILLKNKGNVKHGKYGTRLYRIWSAIKRRCNNPNTINYKDYGGRGITMCNEWLNNFLSFHEWALNNGYKDNLTIERLNVNESYSPLNCKWVTYKRQNNNKRNSFKIIIAQKKGVALKLAAESFKITANGKQKAKI